MLRDSMGRAATAVIWAGVLLLTVWLAFTSCSAQVECGERGQAGRWNPWSGTVCYGEKP